MEDQPEFGVRMRGYSRREVDEFLREVRQELRLQSGGSGEIRTLTQSPHGEGAAARTSLLAGEAADQRGAEVAEQAEETLRAARDLADRIAYEAEELKRRSLSDADRLLADARAEHARMLSDARTEHDRLLADARQRAVELEEQVVRALEIEVRERIGELSRTHARYVDGLTGMRDALAGVLELDAAQGPLTAMVPTQLKVVT
ncbi:hypothetical protein GCM10027589_14630 [Actinocorallia lasiicapitis]